MTRPCGGRWSPLSPADTGLSLIEVLVALSLLALVSASLLAATGAGLQAWLDARDAMLLDRRTADGNAQLLATIAAMVPMPATESPERGASFPFFQGEPRMMRFVTTHSATHRGRGGLRLLTLRVASAPGGLKLVLDEAPCQGPDGLGELLETGARSSPGAVGGRLVFAPEFAREDSWTVADRLAVCRFAYLRDGLDGQSVWLSLWDDQHALPRAVRIELAERTRAGSAGRPRPIRITAAVLAEAGAAGAWF